MTTITLEELERQCIKTEQSYLKDWATGDPGFVAIVPKVKDKTAEKVKVFDDFYADILINGDHTPTVVMIKCKDVRIYLRKLRGESIDIPKRIRDTIKKFYRRNE
jgi:hypothetical protein